MKIDIVLTACNDVYKYISYYPTVYKVWKQRFNLDLYLILINDKIPDYLQEYKDTIILFPEFDKIHSGFISQVIRILYPALFENKNVLITDMDIIPISKKYFIDSISSYDDKKFITYTDRYINRKNQDPLYAICYNVANSKTWKEIFNINNENDIKNIIKEWYDSGYTGKKNCPGWYKDQLKLYEYVQNWERKNKDLIIKLSEVEKSPDPSTVRPKQFLKPDKKYEVCHTNSYYSWHSILINYIYYLLHY